LDLYYSPNLAPCDYFLFLKLKLKLKEKQFNIILNIQKASTDYFDHLKGRLLAEFSKAI